MFTGLSAFPLTPLKEEVVDEAAFAGLIDRLVQARVDSIGVLGSTGNYMYFDREERRRITELAVGQAQAAAIPVMASISALRVRDVLNLAEDAQRAGVKAVLLAPVSYQPLTDEETYSLYEQVTRHLSVPLCVYDNPRTTKFVFSDELHGRIAALPRVQSIKLPGVPADPKEAAERVNRLRAFVPDGFALGVSVDRYGASGLNAGCDVWYSVLGGLFPRTCLELVRHAQAGRAEEALRLSERLEPIWALFDRHGGLRVAAAIAIKLGLSEAPALPLPLAPIEQAELQEIEGLLEFLSAQEGIAKAKIE
ncbi:dihydrodipicolinate synthase family protein [Saccharibacillus sp. O23]|uniref:dihydrodipicolinate synthase family protein n=1 Tax=Saccharibacillus sp. O23 TaxID=2009338 RepID=UPI000B4E31DA|nr:dihydrodipicolinate synthase family protein [Saccharibacillus sp. O23]OWR32589.1 dihydrodipicolinate synthase family protein [Saccharibacillus sp. O23]